MTKSHSPCTAPACPTCERWRAYGRFAYAAFGDREGAFEVATSGYDEVIWEAYWKDLDALAQLMREHARLELALTDARSDLESFMEHHKATEAQNARLRAEAANRLPISKSVTRRLDAQGVTGKVGKITKAEPR